MITPLFCWRSALTLRVRAEENHFCNLATKILVNEAPKINRRIHIHLKFRFLKFVLVNNHRVVFLGLDTLTESIFLKIGLGIIRGNQVTRQVPNRYIGE